MGRKGRDGSLSSPPEDCGSLRGGGGGWFSEARAGPLIPPHLHFALPVAEAEAAVFP